MKIILALTVIAAVILIGCTGPQPQFQPVQIPPALTNLVDQITTDLTPIVRVAASNAVYNAINKQK